MQPQLLHQPQRFPRDDAPDAIVRGPVPTSHESMCAPSSDDLVRLLAAREFRQRRSRTRRPVRSARSSPAACARIVRARSGGRCGWCLRGKSRRRESAAGPARTERCRCARFADRSGPTDRTSTADRAELRGRAGAGGAIGDRLRVVGVRHVEEDDPALRVGGARLQVLEAVDRQDLRLDTFGRRRTVPPSPSIATSWRGGSTISALSRPRTQCGTITGSVCTFSRPSAFIFSADHAIARARLSDPESRAPCRSVNSASRRHANHWMSLRASDARRPRGRHSASQGSIARGRTPAPGHDRSDEEPTGGTHGLSLL